MAEIDKMTQKSQLAMQAAASQAESRQNPAVEPEHLIGELLNQDDGIVPRVLSSMQIDPLPIIEEMDRRVQNFPQVSGTGVKVVASNDLSKLFQEAEKTARQMGDSYISTEHFFLAALRGVGSREVQRILERHGVDLCRSDCRASKHQQRSRFFFR